MSMLILVAAPDDLLRHQVKVTFAWSVFFLSLVISQRNVNISGALASTDRYIELHAYASWRTRANIAISCILHSLSFLYPCKTSLIRLDVHNTTVYWSNYTTSLYFCMHALIKLRKSGSFLLHQTIKTLTKVQHWQQGKKISDHKSLNNQFIIHVYYRRTQIIYIQAHISYNYKRKQATIFDGYLYQTRWYFL